MAITLLLRLSSKILQYKAERLIFKNCAMTIDLTNEELEILAFSVSGKAYSESAGCFYQRLLRKYKNDFDTDKLDRFAERLIRISKENPPSADKYPPFVHMPFEDISLSAVYPPYERVLDSIEDAKLRWGPSI